MNLNRQRYIEQLTLDILKKYNITENPAKHLKEITDGEKITLMDITTWNAEKCGRLMYIEEEAVIFYNAKHTEQMKNFTIAHELGHYFLGHLDNCEVEKVCLHRDFQRIEQSRDEKQQREVEANFFASCLLMPLDLFYPLIKDYMQRVNRVGPIYVDRQRCNFKEYRDCIFFVQLHFTVSESAIRFRLIKLNLLSFNIDFKADEDKGISIAKYLEKNDVTEKLLKN